MKALVVYYTHSGNTRRMAELIAAQTQAQCLEITPVTAYPKAYNTVVKQAKKEIHEGFQPEISTEMPDLSAYDVLFVGTPNWWSSIAPPIATFLSQCSLAGKKVAPFCTHGGGGAGHVQRDVENLCAGAQVLPMLASYDAACTQKDVDKWMESIQLR